MRIIMHFDIDAFFAAVEVLKNPDLAGKPVVVGGTERRGVVSTASYEARRYGIHSAMSTAMAKQLCPHAIFVRGSFDLYSQYSKAIFNVMHDVATEIEKVGIDEGYLDVTDQIRKALEAMDKTFGEPSLEDAAWREGATAFAMMLKARVNAQTGLTISVGISYNKFLAKLASDWKKPNGLFLIAPSEVRTLLDPLPLSKVHGLGKKSVQKLNGVGLFSVRDMMGLPLEHMGYFLGGSWASEIYDRIRGIDDRPLVTHYERKSYGKETTFDEDIVDFKVLHGVLATYLESLVGALKVKQLVAKTLTVKVKLSDFTQFTRSHSLDRATDDLLILTAAMGDLLFGIEESFFKVANVQSPGAMWTTTPEYQGEESNKVQAVRLIGVTLSNVSVMENQQISLLDHWL